MKGDVYRATPKVGGGFRDTPEEAGPPFFFFF
jgi:hypothetical protein